MSSSSRPLTYHLVVLWEERRLAHEHLRERSLAHGGLAAYRDLATKGQALLLLPLVGCPLINHRSRRQPTTSMRACCSSSLSRNALRRTHTRSLVVGVCNRREADGPSLTHPLSLSLSLCPLFRRIIEFSTANLVNEAEDACTRCAMRNERAWMSMVIQQRVFRADDAFAGVSRYVRVSSRRRRERDATQRS